MTDDDDTQVYRSELEAAVKAAVLAEREACAKLCDEYARSGSDHEASAALNIQDAIRARGEKP
jgi:hypothetical protein